LSKIALALGVTLFMWGGIRFLLSVGEENKMKKARDDLILVGVGLLLTLASLAILYLLQTVPRGIDI
jgi:multisubunit Na+/H+ antiporter MnhB subunit